MEDLKNYRVASEHLVYEDDFNKGELEQVNCYFENQVVSATSPLEAIENYFEHLGYDYNIEQAWIDGEFLDYSVLVDNDNLPANEVEIEEWKSGELKLYANNIRVSVEKMELVDLEELV